MARVTVEDCVDKVPNRFELVMLASRRARQLGAGAPLTLDRDQDKNPVVALREIAAENLDLESLEQDLVRSYQRVHRPDEDSPALVELMDGERAQLENRAGAEDYNPSDLEAELAAAAAGADDEPVFADAAEEEMPAPDALDMTDPDAEPFGEEGEELDDDLMDDEGDDF